LPNATVCPGYVLMPGWGGGPWRAGTRGPATSSRSKDRSDGVRCIRGRGAVCLKSPRGPFPITIASKPRTGDYASIRPWLSYQYLPAVPNGGLRSSSSVVGVSELGSTREGLVSALGGLAWKGPGLVVDLEALAKTEDRRDTTVPEDTHRSKAGVAKDLRGHCHLLGEHLIESKDAAAGNSSRPSASADRAARRSSARVAARSARRDARQAGSISASSKGRCASGCRAGSRA